MHGHIERNPLDPRLPRVTNTSIGKICFIGVRATILPGVRIGDEVVGASTVVTRDVPSHCVAVGNPGTLVKAGIRMRDKAILHVVSGAEEIAGAAWRMLQAEGTQEGG